MSLLLLLLLLLGGFQILFRGYTACDQDRSVVRATTGTCGTGAGWEHVLLLLCVQGTARILHQHRICSNTAETAGRSHSWIVPLSIERKQSLLWLLRTNISSHISVAVVATSTNTAWRR